MHNSSLLKVFHPLREWCLDLIFPKECIGNCGSSSSHFCIDCAWKMDLSEKQACPACGKYEPHGLLCASKSCRKNSFIDQLLVIFDYHENHFISEAIHIFKYRFAQDLGHNFAMLMLKKFWRLFSEYNSAYDMAFVPVPLHEKRFMFRGFNQAEILARELSNLSGRPMLNLLKRIKYSKPQADLNGYQRRKNLVGSFQIQQLPPAQTIIVLVDDVYTTGTTLNECARILKTHGASWIIALTLARSRA